ncbi:hypothetical protein [Nonomuraea longicatena]|uniref:Uncharacterized protein n=1 Tax=Nonomuraea longicatena TaxID=83682 RepID=A0ABP4BK49_9ACTN
MTLLAATATGQGATATATLPPPLTLIITGALLAALVWALGYAAACAVAPFARCRRCEGVGKTITPKGRVKRWCRYCQSTGLRLRIGRRLYNYLRRLRHDGTR